MTGNVRRRYNANTNNKLNEDNTGEAVTGETLEDVIMRTNNKLNEGNTV